MESRIADLRDVGLNPTRSFALASLKHLSSLFYKSSLTLEKLSANFKLRIFNLYTWYFLSFPLKHQAMLPNIGVNLKPWSHLLLLLAEFNLSPHKCLHRIKPRGLKQENMGTNVLFEVSFTLGDLSNRVLICGPPLPPTSIKTAIGAKVMANVLQSLFSLCFYPVMKIVLHWWYDDSSSKFQESLEAEAIWS